MLNAGGKKLNNLDLVNKHQSQATILAMTQTEDVAEALTLKKVKDFLQHNMKVHITNQTMNNLKKMRQIDASFLFQIYCVYYAHTTY